MTAQDRNLPAVHQSTAPAKSSPPVGPFTMVPKSLEEAMKFAKLIAESSLCPKGFQGKPADVLIAVQMGAELGVSPMQALANIAVINGRACMWGDLVVALVQNSKQLEYLLETWDKATLTATCRIKRRGKPERVETFSMEQAKRIKTKEYGQVIQLSEKDTYKNFPERMCGWRAKTYAIRAEFADVLKGLTTHEEAHDLSQGDSFEAAFTVMPTAPAPDKSAPPPVDLPAVDDDWAKQFAGDAPADGEQPAEADPNAPLTVTKAEKHGAGNHKNGTPWTRWIIEFSDKRHGFTYSSTTFGNAALAMEQKLAVKVEIEPDKTGNPVLKTFEHA